MIKRDEIEHPASCLNKSLDDEPIFVLRAHDPIASEIVRQWIGAYQQRKGHRLTKRELDKVNEAKSLADAMDAWRIAHRQPKKGGE